MDKINLIPRIKDLYEKGENIIQFLKNEDGRELNTIEDILISYDFQAGSYVKYAKENPEYIKSYTGEISKIISELGNFDSIIEVGVGEATTLGNLSLKLNETAKFRGFDISWSRINAGVNYLKELGVDADLFVADLFNIPLQDSSVDIVYTSHSIEPNGGREKEALQELYRITNKYLVLLEPTSEFANDEGRARMKKNGYVQNLKESIEELGYNLIVYKPFEVSVNPLNPTGLYIIQKAVADKKESSISYFDPISKKILEEYQDHFFSRETLLSYPKIMNIPCLCPSYGILTSRHE